MRLRDLCERLDVDSDLRSQMWTCFEHCLVHHTYLMRDRHLDQMLMCSVYVMAKVEKLIIWDFTLLVIYIKPLSQAVYAVVIGIRRNAPSTTV